MQGRFAYKVSMHVCMRGDSWASLAASVVRRFWRMHAVSCSVVVQFHCCSAAGVASHQRPVRHECPQEYWTLRTGAVPPSRGASKRITPSRCGCARWRLCSCRPPSRPQPGSVVFVVGLRALLCVLLVCVPSACVCVCARVRTYESPYMQPSERLASPGECLWRAGNSR